MRMRFVWKVVGLTLCGVLCMVSTGLAAGDSWARKKSASEPIWASAAAVIDGKIYVTGGRTAAGGTPLATLREYDPGMDEWKIKSTMHVARFRHRACAVNGKIYVFGGTQDNHGQSVLSSVEEYDPRTDTWTEKADMPTPRHSLTVSALDGKIYAIGGAKGALSSAWNWVAYKTVEVYDPVTDTWQKMDDMPLSRTTHAAGVVGGRIYLLDGMGGDSNACQFPMNVQEYDPVDDEWERKSFPPSARAYVGGVTVNGKIYVIGGTDLNSNWLRHTYEYDPVSDEWTRRADMPTGRNDTGIGAVDGRIYVIGGWAGTFLSSVEVYTPAGWEPSQGENPPEHSVLPQGKLISTWAYISGSSR